MTDGFGSNDWLVEEMRRRWADSPASVGPAWRAMFEGADGVQPPAVASQQAVAAPQPASPVPDGPPSDSPSPEEPPPGAVPMRGVAARIAERMEDSLSVPTATSVRSVPSKLLEVNRKIINNHLGRSPGGGKVSFTHLIGWAVVRALAERPQVNVAYSLVAGTPHLISHDQVNLGIAVDLPRKDGSRSLLVPNIKGADRMGFVEFWRAYEEVIRRVRDNRITPEDFAGTTVSLTNPGTLGTVQSVPRLMDDHGVIIGVGAIAHPPAFEAADPEFLARMGIGRVITVTSTYDHRVIQGAQSGELLGQIHRYLLGGDGFYDEIFTSMDVPYTPARWAKDDNPAPGTAAWSEKQAKVLRMIDNYRERGHLIANLDPLRQEAPSMPLELDPLSYGLTIWDLDREFGTGGLLGRPVMPLGDVLGVMRDAYCRTLAIEYSHIQQPERKAWLQERIEVRGGGELSRERKIDILRDLNRADAFERFLHTKYLGQKRFSLEGGETLIPALRALLHAAADDNMEDVVIAMAHRGRLNVLANVVGKGYAQVFREFMGGDDEEEDEETTVGSGDVKYHLGASGVHTRGRREVRVHVVANPSHLEAVDPVLEGIVRAKQDRLPRRGQYLVLPVLVHGDAAFSGQGVVAETLHLSLLQGYRTGGTVHLVVNNQVGFTTSAREARSSLYATDVAKTVNAPIFHVNGDDPEASVRAVELAFAYRQAFHTDVVIDLVCYRRRGHNEGDEPSYTQPLMYRLIDRHPAVRELYLSRLVASGDLTSEEAADLVAEFDSLLGEAFEATQDLPPPASAGRVPDPDPVRVESATSLEELAELAALLGTPPAGFEPHPKLLRVLDARREAIERDEVDWGLAEAFAFGSLAREGMSIRLAGEDVNRGTFSHRHAEFVDHRTGEKWSPLKSLESEDVRVRIHDSLLSEFAALGFEYGYSVESPETLVIWEAQFGDFANGAQVIIDQFIAAGEDKWSQQSGVVMLLPHGFEGQGPEHSSARLERYLELCAEHNLRVAMPSTAPSYFHLLRRQAHMPHRKPLVVITPKSLLRTAASFGRIGELTSGTFSRVLDDPRGPSGVRRVVLCSGKVFYDLMAEAPHDVAVVRSELLYPFPEAELVEVVGRHVGADVVWCQEEPRNMGAASWILPRLEQALERRVTIASRAASASPATGSNARHHREQAALVAKAFSA